jgi:hypothetical protein
MSIGATKITVTRLIVAGVVAALTSACSSGAPSSAEPTGTVSQALDPSTFKLPPADVATRTAILARYANVDPTAMIQRGLLEDAIEFFDINKAQIANQKYVTVVDFSLFSGKLRFFVIDMKTGAVDPHMVAHGKGSDPDWTGYTGTTSNVSGSNQSSMGFFLTSDIYDGTHPHSMHIDGLSPDGSPNDMADTNVLSRAIVVHEATYVDDTNTSKQGRSDGCFALDTNIELAIVNQIAHGSLLYAEKKPLNPPIGVVAPNDPGSSSSSGGSTPSSSGGSTHEDPPPPPASNGNPSSAPPAPVSNDAPVAAQGCGLSSAPVRQPGSSLIVLGLAALAFARRQRFGQQKTQRSSSTGGPDSRATRA